MSESLDVREWTGGWDYTNLTAIGAVMLVVSFILLFLVNGLQRWSELRIGKRN